MTIHKEDKKTKIFAIDFDGTIVNHQFPNIGELLPNAKAVINRLHAAGHFIIIWTCRNMTEPENPDWINAPISAVITFLRWQEIHFDSINENHPSMGFWLQARKVFADIYIDDRNMGGFPGWETAEAQINGYLETGLW
jgi:hypothetical protein